MLILILIHVQYSQKAVFSFEKGLNNQNHSLSSSHDLVKKNHPLAKFLIPLPTKWGGGGGGGRGLLLFGKPWDNKISLNVDKTEMILLKVNGKPLILY